MGNKVANLLPKTVAKAAEFYASQFGWRVFPLYEIASSGVCSCNKGAECSTPGKHPRISIPKGETEHPATTDLVQIRKWWRQWPQANIGVWLEGSNLLILDIDRNDKKDGFKGLAEIMAFEGISDSPSTLTCNTPSGGKHLYFKLCEGVPNKANSLGPGLDTWHTKHYVIVPPSNHIKGIYAWDQAMPDAPGDYPAWLRPRDREPLEKRGRGRPPKERLNPHDEDDIERLKHALKFVDSSNRDMWVMVGFAIARAFEWSDHGFEIYNHWASLASNYDPKKTTEQYYKQSKVVPSTPITTASIFEWAAKDPNYKGWERVDARPFRIREHPANELLTLLEIDSIIGNYHVYQRGPELVEIVPGETDVMEGLVRVPKGTYSLRPVAADQLATRILPSQARWERKTPKGWKATRVNQAMASSFLSMGVWRHAQRLVAVTQHPTLRDDGSIVSEIGYDKASRLFVTERVDVKIPAKPTRKDAEKALKVLLAPYAEYHWIDGNLSKAVLLAAIFTVGIRHMLGAAIPMFAVSAAMPGSGKSRLVASISRLWFGHNPAFTPYISDPEELRKTMASVILAGYRMVLFDNVDPRIRVNDPVLNSILTEGRIRHRRLGTDNNVDIESTSTFFMTGNNLNIAGDMIRRTINMHVDPQGTRPQDRVFKIADLCSHVGAHRAELLSAALTILSAYFHAGRPLISKDGGIASFETWSRTIRELLLWLEFDDIKESIQEASADDDEVGDREHLLRVLFDLGELQRGPMGSAEFLSLIDGNRKLKEAMIPFVHEKSGAHISDPRTVTSILRRVKNLSVDGKQLRRSGRVWAIVSDE